MTKNSKKNKRIDTPIVHLAGGQTITARTPGPNNRPPAPEDNKSNNHLEDEKKNVTPPRTNNPQQSDPPDPPPSNPPLQQAPPSVPSPMVLPAHHGISPSPSGTPYKFPTLREQGEGKYPPMNPNDPTIGAKSSYDDSKDQFETPNGDAKYKAPGGPNTIQLAPSVNNHNINNNFTNTIIHATGGQMQSHGMLPSSAPMFTPLNNELYSSGNQQGSSPMLNNQGVPQGYNSPPWSAEQNRALQNQQALPPTVVANHEGQERRSDGLAPFSMVQDEGNGNGRPQLNASQDPMYPAQPFNQASQPGAYALDPMAYFQPLLINQSINQSITKFY